MSDINKAILKLAQENPEFRTALVAELRTAASGEVLKKQFFVGYKDGQKSGRKDGASAFEYSVREADKHFKKLRDLKNWFGPLGMKQGISHSLEEAQQDMAYYAGMHFGQQKAQGNEKVPGIWSARAASDKTALDSSTPRNVSKATMDFAVALSAVIKAGKKLQRLFKKHPVLDPENDWGRGEAAEREVAKVLALLKKWQQATPMMFGVYADSPMHRQGSRPVFLNMNKLWKTLPKRGQLRNSIELKNGTILSIQASEGHYSEPRKDNAPYYTEFEVYVNKGPQLPELRPFAEGGGNHSFVPVGVLNKILKNYGYAGLAFGSRSKRAKHDPAFFDEVLALLPGAKRGRANDPSAFTYKGLKFQLVPDKRPFRWRLTSREHLAAGSAQGNYGIGDPQSAPHLTAQYAKTFVKNVQSGRIQKKADKWETKPKGWTDASRKKFWESLTSAAPKHKVTECIKRMDKHMGGNAGAFCASLADRVMPGWRQEAAKDRKKKKASLTQPLSLRRDYGASDDEWLDQEEVRKHCPPCADKMAANGIRKVKASTLRLAMQRR